jgi:hypothetical protein
MVAIELPINLACKHKKNNLLYVITYRCLWKNPRNSAQISDKQCISPIKRLTLYLNYLIVKKNVGSGGIWTHASEETGALNQRLRPLGHATF